MLAMDLNIGLLAKTGVVAAMAAVAYPTLRLLDTLVGDWIGPVWLLSAFLLPFFLGIALGSMAHGLRGVATGGVAGILVTIAPIALLLVVGDVFDDGVDSVDGPLLTLLLAPLAMAMGSLALPMGVSVRAYRRPGGQG